ncbi:MAG: DNA repair protein RadA [Bacteroidetes bacterium]|nr:DNA repair protein RadA [Bacteroidota bacterium]
MAKSQQFYICSSCGHESPKWLGSCPGCKEWNSFVEETRMTSAAKTHKAKIEGLDSTGSDQPQKLADIQSEAESRFYTKIEEFDRVLGGGCMRGSYVLLGGAPGVGKSTLTLQIAKANSTLKILYCAGEESVMQIKQRALRMGVQSENLWLINETRIEAIIQQAQNLSPDLLIVDSIQTVYRDELSSMPGSVQQVKECAALLQQLAKKSQLAIMIIGHITKEGDLAGPRVLEHMVDTVLQFEGDDQYSYRLLRSIKNRFGPAHEVGVFEMKSDGLEEVKNPSAYFLSERNEAISGSAISCVLEGSRPILIEIQALVSPSAYGTPQRTVSGMDRNRVLLLLAVLEKRTGFRFSDKDVYVNVAGGFKIKDPASDLALCMALVSSLLDIPLNHQEMWLSEIGLGGELRKVAQLERRLKEAQKLGYKQGYEAGKKGSKPQLSDIVTTLARA